MHLASVTHQLTRGRPNVHHVEDWPSVGASCGLARSRIRRDTLVNFQLVLTRFIPKQQKGTDLDLRGGQEDIEYCRGLKEQQGPTGNKEGWQVFVERPGVWVSKNQISNFYGS